MQLNPKIPNFLFRPSLAFPAFLIGQAILNSLAFHIPLILNAPSFTPRDLLHPDSEAPITTALGSFLLAPLAPSGSWISTLVQAYIVYRNFGSPNAHAFGLLSRIYLAWIPTALLRTLIAFIFTRAVGWAYPSLFRHWALYEKSSGWGAGLIGWAYLSLLSSRSRRTVGPQTAVERLKNAFHTLLNLHEPPTQRTPPLIVLTLVLALSESRPWTYACALMATGLVRLAIILRPQFITSSTNKDEHFPLELEDLPHPSTSIRHAQPNLTFRTFISQTFIPALRATFIPILVLSIPYIFTSITHLPAQPTPLPSTSLDILILSYPRPGNVSVIENTIQTTIHSFLPLDQEKVTINVFTHSTQHPAFTNVQSTYLDVNPNVQFYVDTDSHPADEYEAGQYLHLAEALRYLKEKAQVAEWIMIVEDDFPLCPGWGEDVLGRVMWILEMSRQDGIGSRAGFVGTGGRTLLPALELTLRTHARRGNGIQWTPLKKPADVVMQDCLLGKEPICARLLQLMAISLSPETPLPPSVERDITDLVQQEGFTSIPLPSELSLVQHQLTKVIVPSRLSMDHIGGMLSTTQGKKGNSDKWRCGWRHAFHGSRGVGVIAV
ncbi:hypothetical protein WG66_009040 [Moniliophthora roreri]|nr:hypothetical protein WG66_009040 [Moniliophthora roreri]